LVVLEVSFLIIHLLSNFNLNYLKDKLI